MRRLRSPKSDWNKRRYLLSAIAAGAVGLPLASLAAVLTQRGAWGLALDLPRALRSQIPADALVLETMLVSIAAPLAGVAIATNWTRPVSHRHPRPAIERVRRAAWRVAWQLILGALLFAASSTVLASAVGGATVSPVSDVAVPHATLFVVTLALGTAGALSAALLAHPLDAAAGAIGVSVLATFGVLTGGPGMASLSTGAINAALQASPLVAIASAADLDLLRSEWLYRLSPIAHLRFDYPTALATCGWYGGLTVAAFVAFTLTLKRRLHA